MTSAIVTLEQAGIARGNLSTNIDGFGGVTFHYGGDPISGFPWGHERCASIWRAWDAYHRSKGWQMVAYSYGVCHHGFIFEGRGAGYRTAAQGTNAGNQHSHAVCYIAGVGQALTDVAKQAMLDARHLCRQGPRGANDEIHPHSHWHSTSCPGDEIAQWIAAGAAAPSVAWLPPAQPKMVDPFAAFAATPTGRGYIEVDVKGGVFCFGDAMFFGSLPGLEVKPNKPIVAAAISPSGGGYWLAAADGGVFCFGDARYHGGLGAIALNKPVDEFEATRAGDGYWMAAADAGVFAFGAAPFVGSAA